MGRQPHLLYPSIHRVLVDVEMLGDILNSDPSFFMSHFIPLCSVLPASEVSRQAGQSGTNEHVRNQTDLYTTGPIQSKTNGGIPKIYCMFRFHNLAHIMFIMVFGVNLGGWCKWGIRMDLNDRKGPIFDVE